MTFPLWQHQIEGIEKAKGKPGFGFFMEMGTGKTRAMIEVLRHLQEKTGRPLRTVVIAPPVVVPQWKQEFIKYSDMDPGKIILLNGSGSKRAQTIRHQGFYGTGVETLLYNKIFVANYSILNMPLPLSWLAKWEPEVVVLDESHRLKNPSTKSSKAAYELANPMNIQTRQLAPKPFTFILTGTPILNSPSDLFQQFKIMLGGFPCPDRMIYNFFEFRSRYFKDRNAGMPKQVYFPKFEPKTLEKDGEDSVSVLSRVIDPFIYRKTKAECLDLPEEISTNVPVEMGKEQAQAYESMERDFIAYVGSSACVAQLAIVKALRLMQITSGFMSLHSQGEEDAPKPYFFTEDLKLLALKELLEQIRDEGKKVLIWSVWRPTFGRIEQACIDVGLKVVQCHGGVSMKDKMEAVQRFKQDPYTSVFLGHPMSGGIGLNLVEAPYSIFYSRNFSLEQYLQARSRNHRGGAKEAGHQSITHYDLYCRGTIEEMVLERLSGKEEVSGKILSEIGQGLRLRFFQERRSA